MILFAVLLFQQVDEVTESPNDNSNVDGDHEHTYAGLRTEKREEGKFIHFLVHRNPSKI